MNAGCDLSVVVVFFNMRREAARTLRSLTPAYQRDTETIRYEVIAVDSGSTQPLDLSWVQGFGADFHYVYFETGAPSPCGAINHGVSLAQAPLVTLCIDGARILSPGVLSRSLQATKAHEKSFVYTFGMHIGHRSQNYLAEQGYSRSDEDRLLAALDWERDGYLLFDVSSVALSSGEGYDSSLCESNCVTIARAAYERLGGFDEHFSSPGGGLANLDFFNRLHESPDLQPVMLLGEATFHQFHGGTATNVPLSDHPWPVMASEYERIRGRPYRQAYRKPIHFGSPHPKSARFLR